MSVDLEKNKSSILDAYKDVLSDSSETDWLLLGYEGTTNVLKVISKGDGGLMELQEDLNAGKVLYGFIKILEPEAQVTKYVLLHWQGEASPNSRRAVSASHLLQVKSLLKGASIEISATNEDDIDEDKILEKLRKIVATIGFTKATKEVSSPVVEEKPKQFVPSPVRSPIKIPPPAPVSPPPAKKVVEKPKSPQKIVSPFLNPTISTPTTTNEPAKPQNGSSNGDSGPSHVNKIRAMFSQQKQDEAAASNGDAMTKKQPPAKPIRNSIARKMEEQKAIFEKSMLNEPVKSTKQDDILREIQAAKEQAKKETEQEPVVPQEQTYQKVEDEQKMEEERCIKELEQQDFHNMPTETVNEVPNENINTEELNYDPDTMLKARALYDYQAADETEISFDPGDLITHIDQIDEGWWQGLAPDGVSYGLFPSNYVELIQ
ncbi:drebrin-like protein [Culicoides brevitarsis]|uniref:drebrin-like protein n=1 Tax=Culicoides brevitarsis TaxID=469753 RepID=UPI00307CB98F